MAKRNRTSSGTNVQTVRQQNAQSAQGNSQYGTEFASETDVQEVRKRNQEAESRKSQNS
jgi:small acid-soluble spore protein E (minor gamma-type SASP)